MKNIYKILLMCCTISACAPKVQKTESAINQPLPFIMDMVHDNPGEGATTSAFNNPEYLAEMGYNGLVGMWYTNCAITYDNFEKDIVAPGTEERRWIENRAAFIDKKVEACDKAGIDVYAFTDIFVAPKSIWAKYGKKMGLKETNLHGYGGAEENVRKPNIQSEIIQQLVKAQIDGIFSRFPSMDGLVMRFGETYLHDTPFHMGGKPVRQGEEGILDHVTLLNILREEICVKRHKKLFYRTWDFGWFHTDPDVYLSITNQIEPHENLFFSIKHTKGDFLRTFSFNPTLGIGKHQQIVEVQCQREYEGKGSHPNYVAEAVLKGFEEYENTASPKCLNDLKLNPNFKGVWTWSRGGGWKGPYITNELWCQQNAFVLSQWAKNTALSEKEIFGKYCQQLGLSKKDALTFRELSLLSNRGVFYGRSSKLTKINPWWIRDQFMGGLTAPAFNDFTSEAWGKTNKEFAEIVAKGIVDEILEEKAMAVDFWKEIETKAQSITSGDDKFRDYLRVSSSYGRIKYQIVEQAWIVMLKGLEGEKTGSFEKKRIQDAAKKYNSLWEEFKALKANNEQCASLYLPYAFDYHKKEFYGEEGMEKAVRKYEKMSVFK